MIFKLVNSAASHQHGHLHTVGYSSSLLLAAGINMLMVGVHGPHAPCEEVFVKHMGNKLYNVTYAIKDKGSYQIIVKWGDDNVPGSPYKVVAP